MWGRGQEAWCVVFYSNVRWWCMIRKSRLNIVKQDRIELCTFVISINVIYDTYIGYVYPPTPPKSHNLWSHVQNKIITNTKCALCTVCITVHTTGYLYPCVGSKCQIQFKSPPLLRNCNPRCKTYISHALDIALIWWNPMTSTGFPNVASHCTTFRCI